VKLFTGRVTRLIARLAFLLGLILISLIAKSVIVSATHHVATPARHPQTGPILFCADHGSMYSGGAMIRIQGKLTRCEQGRWVVLGPLVPE